MGLHPVFGIRGHAQKADINFMAMIAFCLSGEAVCVSLQLEKPKIKES